LLEYLDGGSALHLNLEEKLHAKGNLALLDLAAKTGCNYFCVNVRITLCNSCQHIDKRTRHSCSKCGSNDIDYGTRVIGYLKRVSAFSKARRAEHQRRHYHWQSHADIPSLVQPQTDTQHQNVQHPSAKPQTEPATP
jgi:ribonucleoside-triphosphate reductase (formate)